MRRLLALASLGIALGLPTHSLGARDPRSEVANSQPLALVWGNGVFVRQAGIARWLAAHHQTYAAWAPLHPAGREILRTSASLPVRFRPSQHAPTTSPPPEFPRWPAAGGSSVSSLLVALLGVAAALLLAIALLPQPRFADRFPVMALLAQRRHTSAVAAVAIVVGIAAAKLAG
jgi:hypothetical protein